ncbi:MAG: patatin-like phospholipase family protein [Limnobacter sp.]|nr:patatin-like phospholipase family protein [Limnobacter sp.]
MKALEIYAGKAARKHLLMHGFNPLDVFAIPGAAGGPKGLILQGLDQLLFGEVFQPDALKTRKEPLQLIGASIGAWRMAAACAPNPLAALARLSTLYSEAQRYRKGVTSREISAICDDMLAGIIGGQSKQITQPSGKQLMIWVNRGKPPLYHPVKRKARKRGFAAATLANGLKREKLSGYFERWVFATGAQPDWLQTPFDGMDCRFETLTPDNLQGALLGSASIPFVLDAVESIPNSQGQPIEGPFWDGGLTDYHLALPYSRQNGLVLYPHFGPKVVPGWLDKFLKKRKANPQWMSNVLLICPSAEFIDSLPDRKIPDRSDFKRYGLDHDSRIRNWRAAIAESERMAEEFGNWVQKPDLSMIQDLQ